MCQCRRCQLFGTWPRFKVHDCQACGFRFIDTNAVEYSPESQIHYEEPPTSPLRTDWPHIQRRVADVVRHKCEPGIALDIGCGRGEFIAALQQRGFECVGMDLNSERIARARAQFPMVEWRTGIASDLLSETRRFDVVTLFHCLEHIPDPKRALQDVRKVMAPGGLLAIEVPNVGGVEARLKGRTWHYYKEDHVNYFRTSDLLGLAPNLGLNVVDVRGYQHFSFPQNVWWKDAIKGAMATIGFKDVTSVFLTAEPD